MRDLLNLAALLISGCSFSAANPLLMDDWTNGQQPCSVSKLSFKNERIGFHLKDDDIPLFDIVSANTRTNDPELVLLHVKPAKELQGNIARVGLDWPSTSQPTFLFRVHANRLSLVAMSRNAADPMHNATYDEALRFDLIACRSVAS